MRCVQSAICVLMVSYFWNSRVTFRRGYRGRERAAVLRFSLVLLSGVALAAATSAVVKNAWKRHASNKGDCCTSR